MRPIRLTRPGRALPAFALALAAAARADPPAEPQLRIEAGMHATILTRVAADKLGRFLLTSSYDKTARLWSAETGALLRVFRPPIDARDDGKLYAAALSPDARLVALAGYTGYDWDGAISAYIFDRQSGAMLRRLSGGPEIVKYLAFAPDGRRLAAGDTRGLRVFDVESGALAFDDRDFADECYGLDFAADGRLFATGYDGFLRLYDRAGTRVRKVAAPHGKRPRGISVHPDGARVAVGYEDSPAVDVLAAADLSLQTSLPNADATEGLMNVRWSLDGRALAAAGLFAKDGVDQLRRFDSLDGQPRDFDASADTVREVWPLPGGAFAVGGADPLLAVVDAQGRRRIVKASPIADFRGDALQVNADGTAIAFSWDWKDGQPAVFDVAERVLRAGPLPAGLHGAAREAAGLQLSDWLQSAAPRVNGHLVQLDNRELSRSAAIAPDGKAALLGATWSLREVGADGQTRWVTKAPAVAWSVSYSGDGRLAIGAFADGTVRWFRASDGRELLALFAHRDQRRWVLFTPSGYFDASPGGEELIGWHVNRGAAHEADFFPAARFRSRFYRPDVLARVLRTLDEKAALEAADGSPAHAGRQAALLLPPVARIVAPVEGDSFSGDKIALRVAVRSPGAKVTLVRALVDGRPAGDEHAVLPSDGGEATLEVPLPPHDCTVAVLAEAGGAIGEADQVRLRWTPPAVDRTLTPAVDRARASAVDRALAPAEASAPLLPRLFALAVGVGRYAEPALQLDFAAKDARDLAAVLAKQRGVLYRSVEIRVLTDADASRDAIEDGLEWLKRSTSARDVAVLFLAGRGRSDASSGYRYLPGGAGAAVDATLLPGATIREALAAVPGKAVLMLDTRGACDPNGFVNELASVENGVVVFAASAGAQAAQESKEWGNGAFARALVEALSGKADARGTGRVTIDMIDRYVSERVRELTGGRQTPVATRPASIADFALSASK